MSKELELIPNKPIAVAESAPTPLAMMREMFKAGVNPENVAAFEKMAELAWKFEERDGRKAFAAAFVKLQSELPTIVASSDIPNRGKYERFEDVMRQVGPPMQANGFSVAFSMDANEHRITVTCKLSHVGGHSESNSFSVRVSSKADSETQADCKAATTAKRNALLQALNIVVRQDCLQEEDANPMNEGSPITLEQAEELYNRVTDTESDHAKFLKLAGVSVVGQPKADDYRKILSGKYNMLDELLRKKESRGR